MLGLRNGKFRLLPTGDARPARGFTVKGGRHFSTYTLTRGHAAPSNDPLSGMGGGADPEKPPQLAQEGSACK